MIYTIDLTNQAIELATLRAENEELRTENDALLVRYWEQKSKCMELQKQLTRTQRSDEANFNRWQKCLTENEELLAQHIKLIDELNKSRDHEEQTT